MSDKSQAVPCGWWACPLSIEDRPKDDSSPCNDYNWAAGSESPCKGKRMTAPTISEKNMREADEIVRKYHSASRFELHLGQLIATALQSKDDEIERYAHLLNHIYREVSSLEDFDADSLKKEIEATINGTKIYNDTKVLEREIERLRAAAKAIINEGLDTGGLPILAGLMHDLREALAAHDQRREGK